MRAFPTAFLSLLKRLYPNPLICDQIKFSDDTTVEGLNQNSDETVYRADVDRLVGWCSENNLELNVSLTKELVVNFRRKKTPIEPFIINDETYH